MGEINAAHPFREGNGRAQRAFCAQLAEQAGYFIDFRRKWGRTPISGIEATHALTPVPGTRPRLAKFEIVLDTCIANAMHPRLL